MRTVTFYSYKGGVGRTLAVANTAIRLAREGLKVFALDFDLEAPGLHHKFNLFPNRQALVIELGLIDFLHEFITFDRFPDTLAGHVIDVSEKSGKASSIHFMPAGRAPSAKYAEHLARSDWHALFYAEGGDGVPLFLELKERIRAEYAPDVLLIDARTGISMPDARTTRVDSTPVEEAPPISGPPPHNLPARCHFVGREPELDVIAAALARPTGPSMRPAARCACWPRRATRGSRSARRRRSECCRRRRRVNWRSISRGSETAWSWRLWIASC